MKTYCLVLEGRLDHLLFEQGRVGTPAILAEAIVGSACGSAACLSRRGGIGCGGVFVFILRPTAFEHGLQDHRV